MTPDHLIVLTTDFRLSGKLLEPADVLDPKRLIADRVLSEDLIDSLKVQRRLGKFDRENLAIALARRPAGSAWPRHLDREQLIADGLLEEKTAPPEKKRRDPKPAAAKAPVGLVAPTPDSELLEGLYITGRKAGAFPVYYVTDDQGVPKRDSAFRTKEKARAFITELNAGASTDGATSGTSGQ